jgi:uncharacterized protein involved in outer membrane biogenesis
MSEEAEMWKKTVVAVVALLILALIGGFLFLRSLVSDDNVRATLQDRLAAALGQPVQIGRAHLAFSPKIGIELADVEVGQPPQVHIGAVRLATGLRPLLSRRVEGAEVIVEHGQINLPLPPIGGVTGATAPVAPAQRGTGITLVSVDTIAFRDIAVTSGERTIALDLETTLAANRLDITRLRARADQTVIEGTGAITDLTALHGTLDLKANDLDLDRLMTFLSAFGSERSGSSASTPKSGARPPRSAPGGAVPDARLVVTLAAPSGRLAGIMLTDLNARATVTPTTVLLEPLTFGVFGGQYAGSLTLDVSTPIPAFSWNASLNQVKVAEALKYAGAADVMTGTLAGRIRLSGAGADATAALKTVKGSGRLDVRDGALPTLKLVSAVARALGTPAPQQAGAGDAFSALGGSFALANGVLTSNDLALDARDLDASGAGAVSLVGGTIDMRANLRLSPELSASLGRGATRFAGEGGRVVLPAVVRGPLAQPVVSVDVASVAGRAATNELKRQLEKGLGSLLKKKKGGG